MIHPHKGFTLVETAIVLVIIGLITAGIFSGRVLIKQAQLRAVVQETDKFRTAFSVFMLRYTAVPGDFNKASQFFTACITDPGQSLNICDGDGDGKIRTNSLGPFELKRTWQHLALADILPGSYTGYTLDKGAPSGFPGTEWIAAFEGYTFRQANAFIVGKPVNVDVGGGVIIRMAGNSFLTAKEMASLDTKYDDGLAAKGRIIAQPGADSGGIGIACIDNNPFNTTAINYILTNETIACIPTFLQ